MKKLVSLLLVLCISFALVACSSEPERMEGYYLGYDGSFVYEGQEIVHYLQLNLDGSFEFCATWEPWKIGNTWNLSHVYRGTYQIKKASFGEKYLVFDFIQEEEMSDESYEEICDYTRLWIIDDNTLAENKNGTGKYIKQN